MAHGDKPLRIAIISDIHHGTPSRYRGAWRKLSQHAVALTEAFVRRMNDEVRPDLVAHLGDAVQDVDEETDRRLYTEAMALLGPLEAPIFHVTGNHDERFLSDGELDALRGAGVLRLPFDFGGHRFVGLPSHNTLSRCWVEEADVAALREELGRGDGPVLLFMHHALADSDLMGNPWFEDAPQQCLIEGRAEVRELLERSERIRAVFNGHLHHNRLDVHGRIPYFTVHSVVENIAPPDAEPLPAAAWSLVEVDAAGLDVQVFGNAPACWPWRRHVPVG